MDNFPSKDEAFQKIEYKDLGVTIHAKLNTDREEILGNIKRNAEHGHPQVWPHREQSTAIILVAGGPSLSKGIEGIRKAQKEGGKVVALANTAKVLMDNGIRPNAHVFLDAMPNNKNFVTDADTTYFVASQCNPEVLNRLKDKRVFIWHAMNSDKEFELVTELYEKWVPIQGGSTIALRALRLFSVLGYHKFDIYGMDSCYLNGRHHAYDQPNADIYEAVGIKLNGKKFQCAAWMIQQSMDFLQMVRVFGDHWKLQVHGEGLISTMISEGAK